MHMNGTAPLEASSEEALTSAYLTITVQLQEATENVCMRKKQFACLLHFDNFLKCFMHLF